MTENSKDFLKSEGYTGVCELRLWESGTFELTNAPDFMFDTFGRNYGEAINKNGNWSVSCEESYNCMFELNGIAVVPVARKNSGPISILITIGDGDECNGIIFERKDIKNTGAQQIAK